MTKHTMTRSGVDPDTGLDFDATYVASGYLGIAWYLVGYATEWDRRDQEIEQKGQVRAIMVGDDTVHILDVSDLTVVDADDVCSCGSVGCWSPNATSGE